MNISEFIEQQVNAIVDEWVEFARTRVPLSREIARGELADHARVLLLAIAADLRRGQGAQAAYEKSQGNRPGNSPNITRVAQDHAEQRFNKGFSIDDLLSEFRALRASVIRRWTEQLQSPKREHLDELTRFGEAMDQSMTESVSLYTRKVNDSRNRLLGVLGHDLRTPLGVVQMSARYLLQVDTLSGTQTKAAARILTAAERMNAMVKDILDFTQTAFGLTMPIMPAPLDLGQLTKSIVGEVSTVHPDCRIKLSCEGDLAGHWDSARLGQVLANLIANAVQHGAEGQPVALNLHGTADMVRLEVHNEGSPISAQDLQTLFSPLRQTPSSEAERRNGSSGLGLGLYIAKEIVTAHGGSVEVTSGDKGTCFCVQLPRTSSVGAH